MTAPNNESYVIIKSDILLKICTDWMSAGEKHHQKRLDKMIDEEMNKKFFPPKTREKAYKRLKERTKYGVSYLGLYHTTIYSTYYSTVKEIMNLCKFSDEVYLTLDNADTLAYYKSSIKFFTEV